MLRPSTLRPALRAGSRFQCPRAAARRTLFTSKPQPRVSQEYDLKTLHARRRDYEQNRTAFLAAGAIAGVISFIYTAWKLKKAIELRNEQEELKKQQDGNGSAHDDPSRQDKNTLRLDANPSVPSETFKTEAGEMRKVVLHDDEGREIVPTGNSTVPLFPRLMEVKLPTEKNTASGPIEASIAANDGTEFTLVGLGTRTVTFLGIQVYVVGFYVATQDIARLQHYLVKKVNPLATTLIPSEKESLRKSLNDPSEGEEIWTAILRDAGCRSLFRITPVRDTDFHHLRDGFVRAIQARSQRDKDGYGDETFGNAMRDFRAIFNRGSVPKKREMLLCRDAAGSLSVLYNDKEDVESGKPAQKQEVLGSVEEERLSRLLWLNYLAGNKVAAEGARQNIIHGVMEFVERPVGTVATQVL